MSVVFPKNVNSEYAESKSPKQKINGAQRAPLIFAGPIFLYLTAVHFVSLEVLKAFEVPGIGFFAIS